MARLVDLDGAAHLVFTDTVVPLHPHEAVFDAMLVGWHRQQRSRLLTPGTVENRVGIVRRFQAFTNSWPWAVDAVGRRGLDQPPALGHPAVDALDDPQLPEPARAVLLVHHRPALRLGRAVRSTVRCPSGADLSRVERRLPQRPLRGPPRGSCADPRRSCRPSSTTSTTMWARPARTAARAGRRRSATRRCSRSATGGACGAGRPRCSIWPTSAATRPVPSSASSAPATSATARR